MKSKTKNGQEESENTAIKQKKRNQEGARNMTTLLYGMQLIEIINQYYGEEMVTAKYPKCYTKEGIEIGNWGLKEWTRRILNEEEIGELSTFYRPIK